METNQIIMLIVIGVVLLCLLGGYIFYIQLFRIGKNHQQPAVNQEDPFFNPSWKWFLKTPHDEVEIRAYDNIRLKGIYIPSKYKDSDNIAIIAHGYRSFNHDMIALAKLYSDLGFKILMPDQRGHGVSEGDFTTFGHYEKYDLRKWIQFAMRNYGATANILLHGVSMGAATVLSCSAMKIPDNVRMVVADSSYTSLSKLINKNTRPKLFLIFKPILNLYTYLNHRFLLRDIKPLRDVKKSKLPLVLIHGKNDCRVPFSMAERLYDASSAASKCHIYSEDASHGKAYVVDTESYVQKLKSMLSIYFDLHRSDL